MQALREALEALDVEDPLPAWRGRRQNFVHTIRVASRCFGLNPERAFGIPGTALSAQVVRRMAEKMDAENGG